MGAVGRNAQCPCGSGTKYKHCCLRRQDAIELDVARAEALWARMQHWALTVFHDELVSALDEHFHASGIGTAEHPVMDDDLSVVLCWLLIDRPLADGGGPPAPRYAERPDISDRDRTLARRIADSRLGVHRVTDVSPGAWIDLENALSGERVRVWSPNVSRDAVRWHVLLGRVMPGGPTPTLWGGAVFYLPDEEPEVLAEVERIATTRGLGTSPAELEQTLRSGPRALVYFIPPSRQVTPMPYTLEGDPVLVAEASWEVRDPGSVLDELTGAADLVAAGEAESGDGLVFGWNTPRDDLMADRRELPRGALCLESRPILVGEDGDLELSDVTSLGTFTLRGARLDFEGMSERRLDAAVALVERLLGDLVGPATRRLRSFDEHRSSTASAAPAGSSGSSGSAGGSSEKELPVADEDVRRLLWRRWIDDPVPRLGGLSPRQAAASGRCRDELELLLRGIEHRSARQQADGAPGSEVAWLRAALGLTAEARAVQPAPKRRPAGISA